MVLYSRHGADTKVNVAATAVRPAPARSDQSIVGVLRGADLGIVARGLGLALLLIAALAAVAAVILTTSESARLTDYLPAFVTMLGFFYGFLVAGMYVARSTVHDRIVHVVLLMGGGFVLAALLMSADLATNTTLVSMLSGSPAGDVATMHLGFWLVTWVAVPAASFLGSAVVPRGEQGWGTQYDEPDDDA